MNKYFFLCLSLFISLSPLCFALEEYGSPQGEELILIAMENTSYKKKLINELIKELDNGNRSIVVVDHKKKEFQSQKAEDYDLIIITNSGVLAKVRPKVQQWLSDNQESWDKVILHTTQTTQWTPQVEVDSITSASDKKNISQINNEIIIKVQRILQ